MSQALRSYSESKLPGCQSLFQPQKLLRKSHSIPNMALSTGLHSQYKRSRFETPMTDRMPFSSTGFLIALAVSTGVMLRFRYTLSYRSLRRDVGHEALTCACGMALTTSWLHRSVTHTRLQSAWQAAVTMP